MFLAKKKERVSKVLSEEGLRFNKNGLDCMGEQDLNLLVEEFLRHAGQTVD